MQILQGRNFRALIEKRANSAGGSVGRRERRDTWNVIANGGSANGFFVVERFATQRRVDDQVDLARFDEVHDVGTSFIHFEHGLRFNPGTFERGSSPARGKQQETEIV